MSYSVKTILPFEKQAKRLIKKYPSLKDELRGLITSLKVSPVQGTALGNNLYKLRLAVASKGKGKSGGSRIITHIVVADETVYLLAIYDKSEQANITDADLKDLLGEIIDD